MILEINGLTDSEKMLEQFAPGRSLGRFETTEVRVMQPSNGEGEHSQCCSTKALKYTP